MKNIMLVDDDPAILDSVSVMLELGGYNVLSTDNGAELMTMENDLPDLILLDIWISGVDGRDICKYLKSKASTRNIPIVLLSASRDIKMSAVNAGANDFIPKPFEMNDLLNKIEQLT